MKWLEIVRIEKHSDCIRGVVKLEGVAVCKTLELPFNDNKTNVSAIPAGIYKGKPHHSPSRGEVFKILDVPGRTDILIHAGNTAKDTQGCVLIGQEYGELEGKTAVINSKAALADLRKHLAGENSFIVEVREDYK